MTNDALGIFDALSKLLEQYFVMAPKCTVHTHYNSLNPLVVGVSVRRGEMAKLKDSKSNYHY